MPHACFDATLVFAHDGKAAVEFLANQKHVASLLELVGTAEGVGTTTGARITIAECLSAVPPLHDVTSPRILSFEAAASRMTYDEIKANIDSSSQLTFDYLALTTAAAAIAAAGLIQDSSVTVVASMLLSPLMSPILAITFGLATCDMAMVHRGWVNELVGVAIAFVIGLVVGSALAPWFGPHAWSSDLDEHAWAALSGSNVSWAFELDSEQINSRGSPKSLVAGTLVAIPSGFGVVLAISGGGANALVGVAIAAALLPPVVNSGLCIALAGWWQWLDPQANWWRDLRDAIAGLDAGAHPRLELVRRTAAVGVSHRRMLGQEALQRDLQRDLQLVESARQALSRLGEGRSRRAALGEAVAQEPSSLWPSPKGHPEGRGLGEAAANYDAATTTRRDTSGDTQASDGQGRERSLSDPPTMAPAEALVQALEDQAREAVFADALHLETVQALVSIADPALSLRSTAPRRHPYIVVAMHGFWSFVLFVVNLVCIVLVGGLTFWLKGVHGESGDALHIFAAEHSKRRSLLRGMWKESLRLVNAGYLQTLAPTHQRSTGATIVQPEGLAPELSPELLAALLADGPEAEKELEKGFTLRRQERPATVRESGGVGMATGEPLIVHTGTASPDSVARSPTSHPPQATDEASIERLSSLILSLRLRKPTTASPLHRTTAANWQEIDEDVMDTLSIWRASSTASLGEGSTTHASGSRAVNAHTAASSGECSYGVGTAPARGTAVPVAWPRFAHGHEMV